MAFTKRNVAIRRDVAPNGSGNPASATRLTGIRPSPLTSHLVTSTGTPSLDDLLGGHFGLALGSCLLIEESGTTDFAGALLRFYAAEGLCHGHVLHIVGVSEAWARELPGLAESRSNRHLDSTKSGEEHMKIAWRYQKPNQGGEKGSALPNHTLVTQQTDVQHEPFCHSFDLTKRLAIAADAKVNYVRLKANFNPLETVVQSLQQALSQSQPDMVHRLVIPTILSPGMYPPSASQPEVFLRTMHSLRALLRQHAGRLTAMITLPLELYPRSSGLVRWAELLSDGVLELTPFPHLMDAATAETGNTASGEEQPQGMLKVHKLPITTERGEGGAGAVNSIGEDLSFTLSRRKFTIRPFSLPPLEGDQEGQKEAGKLTGKDVEF
ncbi:hypothetical protein BAUCODRAFT_27940 [Baudoinia panamericana UAMH 10762]|uniref:Elongator complex protein 4 n=1 Tax=Baudoinia panamericana (strain UAMH 10762) TaxID=717646 RepID=M2MYE7_BAUPA|nr:uncharacterized protein BAUCODRAFT_27940 [Baudoinia panamericana UAMH 10762]EMC91669.1 hypothetical protein BAUCODRAFT_27940 [Baudoinia panamericana UAMH 10762]